MALAVGTLVLTGALTLIDAGSELARDQAQLASLQQSLRVAQSHMVRAVRTAGRGPLPQALLATGPDLHDALAVAVRSNVGDGERIAADPASPLILAGTDVLTLRGVLTGPLYQLAPDALTLDDPDDPTTGSLTIEATTPSGVPHDLTPLRDMIDGWAQSGYEPEALLVVGSLDDAAYAVVEVQPGSTYVETGTQLSRVVLALRVAGGTYTAEFGGLSAGGAYPAGLTTAAFAGVLEEYRYYVRAEHEIPGVETSPFTPRLSRARLYPGTEAAHQHSPAALTVDIADNVLDLQVALGIDTDGDAVLVEGDPPDGDDDWLFNSPADDPTAPRYVVNAGGPSRLFYVRLGTLARTDRRDRGFEAATLGVVEDKDYGLPPGAEYNTTEHRAFRRRWVRSLVDVRNLP